MGPIGWLAVGALGAPCEQPADVATIETTAAAATHAVAHLDLHAFESARDEMWASLPCLDEPMTASAASAVYRTLAYDAFIARDLPGVEAAFGSARQAYPAYRLSSTVAPRGHPLRDGFEAAGERVWGAPIPLPVPLEATLLVHGRYSLDLPPDRPAVLQLLDADGGVSWTTLVATGEPAPLYEAAPETMRADYLERQVVMAAPVRRPVELVVLSGALLSTAAVMHGLAASARGRFEDPATDYSELSALRGQINGYVIGEAVAGVGGVAVGTLAVFRW